jgi:hypothetical protein
MRLNERLGETSAANRGKDGIMDMQTPATTREMPQMQELTLEELETQAQLFREQRRYKGVAQADADWIARPFASWMRGLETAAVASQHETVLEREDMAMLAVGMAETLSIRDALIVSLVAGAGQCSERRMVAFAAHPHDPRNARAMYRLLRGAFEDEQAPLDRRRCRAGVGMMLDVAQFTSGRFGVQPLAVAGYILWWLGDSSALRYALEALDRDDRCTLAAIICSALEHGIGPVNRGKKTAMAGG